MNELFKQFGIGYNYAEYGDILTNGRDPVVCIYIGPYCHINNIFLNVSYWGYPEP